MVDPDNDRAVVNVEIRPDVVTGVAGHVAEVGELIASAATTGRGGAASVTTATGTAADGLTGWTSAASLADALTRWSRKSRALTDGPGGLNDFAAKLKRLVTDTGATDAASATVITTTMTGFADPYRPHLTDADTGPVAAAVENGIDAAKDFFGDLGVPGR